MQIILLSGVQAWKFPSYINKAIPIYNYHTTKITIYEFLHPTGHWNSFYYWPYTAILIKCPFIFKSTLCYFTVPSLKLIKCKLTRWNWKKIQDNIFFAHTSQTRGHQTARVVIIWIESHTFQPRFFRIPLQGLLSVRNYSKDKWIGIKEQHTRMKKECSKTENTKTKCSLNSCDTDTDYRIIITFKYISRALQLQS